MQTKASVGLAVVFHSFKDYSVDVQPLNFMLFLSLVRVPPFPISNHLAKNRFQTAI